MSEKTCVAGPVWLLMRCNGGAAVIVEPGRAWTVSAGQWPCRIGGGRLNGTETR